MRHGSTLILARVVSILMEENEAHWELMTQRESQQSPKKPIRSRRPSSLLATCIDAGNPTMSLRPNWRPD